jgi:hypothetical protein
MRNACQAESHRDEDASDNVKEGAHAINGRWATQSCSVIKQKSEKRSKTNSNKSSCRPPGCT